MVLRSIAAALALTLPAPASAGVLPAYKPGQCLQDYRFQEPWHPEPQIVLIVQSGNYHYLLVPWFKDEKKYGNPYEELIGVANQFKRTLCPARYPDANLPQR